MTDRLSTEVIGFRQWAVTDDLELGSTAVSKVWKRGPNIAVCLASPRCEEAPASGCHCGFYALHHPTFWYGKGGVTRGPFYGFGPLHKRFVSGLVAAWGRLEVHHDGFRAERAKVVAIALPNSKLDAVIARAVAQEYGVPTIPQGELERVASEFGSTVPLGFRPEKSDPYLSLSRLRLAQWAIQPAVRGIQASVINPPKPSSLDRLLGRRRPPIVRFEIKGGE
jgi:hypothetical protein